MPLDVAVDVAEILLATGRTVDPRTWDPTTLERVHEARLAMLPENRL